MSDFKLDAAAEFELDYRSLEGSVSTRSLAPLASAFGLNVARVEALAYAPGTLCDFAFTLGEAKGRAARSVGGSYDYTPPTAAEREAVFAVMRDNLEGIPPRDSLAFGVRIIQGVIDSPMPQFGDYAAAILGSMVTGTWTAFEVLAGDLWEAAINAEPDILSRLKGEPRAGQRQAERQGGYGGRHSIGLDDIHRYGFDIKHRMGTILRADRRFDKLSEIEKSYVLAFSVDEKPVLACLDRGPLDRLSAARNLLVHRGGVVDAEFTRRMGSEPPFAGLAVGDALPLDGELVASIVRPAIASCCALIRAVDEWLVAHPGGRVVERPLAEKGVEFSTDDADRHDEAPSVPDPPVGEL